MKITYGKNTYNNKEIIAVNNCLKIGTQMGKSVDLFEKKYQNFLKKNMV